MYAPNASYGGGTVRELDFLNYIFISTAVHQQFYLLEFLFTQVLHFT